MWRATITSLAAHRRRLLAAGLAVLLGVAFLSATLALRRTVTDGFADLVAEANASVDAVVRSSAEVGRGESTQRVTVDRALVGTVAAVDGVAAASGRVERSGRIVAADGDPIGSGQWIAGSWVEDPRLNPYQVVEGRAPAAPGEVVIDRAAAEAGGLAVGDRTVVRTPDRIAVTVVGLATYGGADSRGSATYAGFAADYAERVLSPEPGTVTSIAVAAAPGVSQAELVRRLDAALPAGVEVVTGAAVVAELAREVQGDDIEGFQQAMLFFAGVALVVATLTINNTYSILVAQRRRESGLLRALGASRAQVLGSVMVEALAVGLLASAGGIAAGMGLATGLLALMGAIDLPVPAGVMALDLGMVATALMVGVVVTAVASLAPAVRAARTAPLAALREAVVDQSATSRPRAVAGGVLAGLGAVVTVVGAIGEGLAATGLGALVTVAGVIVISPVAARTASAALGAPYARWRGPSGLLASRNAVRNPRRTAGTAATLMIGVAVVSLFTVVAASLARSIDAAVAEQWMGDLVISGEGQGGFSTGLAGAVAALPEVAVASPTGGAPVRIDGRGTLATTVDPASAGAVEDLPVRQGSLRDLRTDQIAITVEYADRYGLRLGDPVTVEYPDGASERLTVGAVIVDNLSEVGEPRLHRDAFLAHASRPADTTLLIALADGVSDVEGEAAVQRVADQFGAPDVLTNQEFSDLIAAEINLYLTVIYALLALAIVIALMGIANTLSLSIHERTRELGLLRAVGVTRRQLRVMVRGEALMVALFGTVAGLGTGLFLGWALVSALASEGFSRFAVPVAPLVAALVLGALAGVLAAVLPAARATRMDILRAISHES